MRHQPVPGMLHHLDLDSVDTTPEHGTVRYSLCMLWGRELQDSRSLNCNFGAARRSVFDRRAGKETYAITVVLALSRQTQVRLHCLRQ